MSGPISHVLSWIIIYLCNACSRRFVSRLELPLPNLGFSLVGFTAFHFIVSNKLRHCGTFRSLTIVALRFPSAVICSHIPSVIFSASAITTDIAVCASMDFPLTFVSDYLGRILLLDGIWIKSLFPKEFFQLIDLLQEGNVVARRIVRFFNPIKSLLERSVFDS